VRNARVAVKGAGKPIGQIAMKPPKKSNADLTGSQTRATLAERFEEVKLLRKRVADLERQARGQTESGTCSNTRDVER
jgi:hypothetical protein